MVAKNTAFAELEQDVSRIAKALSHPARITILKILAGLEGCMCGDIVEQLPLAQSTVSQHLKCLKEAGLIKGEIDGPKVCYCIDADALQLFKTNIDTIFEQIHTIRKNSGCC